MRTRLFLSFTLLAAITLLVLVAVTSANTENVITAYSQSGGFFGAERVVQQYALFYAENQSWDQFELHSGSGQPQGGGSGSGPGMMGSGRGDGNGNMGMGGMAQAEQFTLIDPEGVILQSESLTPGDTVANQSLKNAFPILVDGQPVGYLIPENSLNDLSALISEELNTALRKSLLPTALISAGAAVTLSLLLAFLLMRPVRKLTSAADQLSNGDLSQRVPVTSGDELGKLAVSFNQMAASLEELQRARQSMTADIAHELRTPLAVQKANLEALQDGIYPLTQENLTPIIQQNNLLNKLVDDLRTLTLTDTGSLEIDLNSSDVNALAARVVNSFKPEFERQGVHLSFASDPDCPLIEIDQQRIQQVVNNLIQNSLNHTPEGGSVEVRLTCQPDQITLVIRDTGEGIPPLALPHLFDRFYRADQSRSRDKGGTGLGLTIAQRLTQSHGGILTADNHPEGGAVFTMTLPARRD